MTSMKCQPDTELTVNFLINARKGKLKLQAIFSCGV